MRAPAPPKKCKSPAQFFKFIPPGGVSQVFISVAITTTVFCIVIYGRVRRCHNKYGTYISLQSIPKSFRKYLRIKKRSKTATILRRDRRKWQVKINDKWVFEEGWENFVKENGVEDFDIVVFKHEGNMVFDIMVFDPSLCEREYPTNQVTRVRAEQACPEVKSLQKSKIHIKEIGNKLIHLNSEKELGGGSDLINKSTKSLIKIKAEKTVVLDHKHHPYFIGTLNSPSSNYKLYLPFIFAKSIGLSNGKMILRNGQTQISWTVDIKVYPRKSSYNLGQGWGDFYNANGLKQGDSFKLELVQTGINPVANFYRLQTKPSESRGMVETEGLNRHGVLKVTPTEKAAHEILHFKFIATAYSIKNCFMNVPLRFARSNGLVKRICEMVLMDEKQRLWPTKLNGNSDHVYIRGIREMLVANEIKEGDEFLLKLVDNGDKPLMNLHCMKRHQCSHQPTRSSA